MELQISSKKGVPVQPDMIGLFFEDINYAADGGLYAEMLENRAFEFVDCYGTVGDYYTKPDPGYGWETEAALQDAGREKSVAAGQMEYVSGSPVNRANPHYLRFTAKKAGQGFSNQAYDGIYLEQGKSYRVSFYARAAQYPAGDFAVSIEKDGRVFAKAEVSCIHALSLIHI